MAENAYKITPWKYSEEKEEAFIPVEPGIRDLLIEDAKFIDGEEVYHIYFKDLMNEARFSLRYWLIGADDNGNIKPDTRQRGTLITLGKALFGPDFTGGIPHPSDIIGGVVRAEVTLKPNATGDKSYPRIYRYDPTVEELALCGSIEQYYI